MLRSLSKVASTASAAATAAVVSVSGAAAHAEFPTMRYRENSHSRFSKPYPGPQYIDDEFDYDFCQEETYGPFVGGVPSQEEVEEATRDLQTTFIQNEGYRSPRVLTLKTFNDDGNADENVERVICNDTGADHNCSTSTTTLTSSPSQILKRSSSIERSLQPATMGSNNNVVARCVDLLQRDPDIQAAVVSLARDPAIWDAFVKNDKVQDLLRTRSVRVGKLETSREDVRPAKDEENPFLAALMRMRKILFGMMDTVFDMVGNVFGYFDQKIFGGKDSDPLDKPFKACMVLTILVLALIVLKRV